MFNMIKHEMKLVIKSWVFIIFIMITFFFYGFQYFLEVDRLEEPKRDSVQYTEATEDSDILFSGYQDLYGMKNMEYARQYLVIMRKKKLSDNQIKSVEIFMDKMAPNQTYPNLDPNKYGVSVDEMLQFMDNLDKDLGGNTSIGSSHRSFLRPMTYEETMHKFNEEKMEKSFIEQFARVFTDYMGLIAMMFVVFISAFNLSKLKKYEMEEVIYASKVSSSKFILSKLIGQFLSIMLVFLALATVETIIFSIQALQNDLSINVFAFYKYTVYWLSPTVLFVLSFPMLLALLFKNELVALMTQVALSMFMLFTTALKGDYHLIKLMIRYNTLDKQVNYSEFKGAIGLNRGFIMVIVAIIIIATIILWKRRRRHLV